MGVRFGYEFDVSGHPVQGIKFFGGGAVFAVYLSDAIEGLLVDKFVVSVPKERYLLFYSHSDEVVPLGMIFLGF